MTSVGQPDLSDFFAEQAKKGPPCSIALALDALPAKERARLQLALSTPALRHVSISKWLEKAGYKVVSSGVSRHRRKTCGCV